MNLRFVLCVLAALMVSTASAPAGSPPPIHFQVFNHTGIKLTGVLWTGKQFLYIENTTNQLFAGDAKGGPLRPFAKLPEITEETRCAVSPGAHGFPAGWIYCHVPDNRIYRISGNGRTIRLFASLPTTETSDGMLAFDTVGRFGHRLVAATGRSGSASATGGDVYTIDAKGEVRHVGAYAGPGGADGLAIAPASFGSIAGHAMLTVDPGPDAGTIVAMSPAGATRTIALLHDGPNAIAVVSAAGRRSAAAPGLYVADTNTKTVYYARASQFASHAGAVVVGTELQATFWLVRPRGRGFVTRRLPTDLPPASYNLEGADYVP